MFWAAVADTPCRQLYPQRSWRHGEQQTSASSRQPDDMTAKTHGSKAARKLESKPSKLAVKDLMQPLQCRSACWSMRACTGIGIPAASTVLDQ
jgi:hypothetical protein